jgi:DNA-binding response OmpR family regulator
MFDDACERLLDGLHVLVAEDDLIQCDGIAGWLAASGAVVVGPAHTLSEAQQLVAADWANIAVVDIDLGDGASFDLAENLQAKSLPFIFATAFQCRKVPPKFEHVRCLEKPFTQHALVRSLVLTVSETPHWHHGL